MLIIPSEERSVCVTEYQKGLIPRGSALEFDTFYLLVVFVKNISKVYNFEFLELNLVYYISD